MDTYDDVGGGRRAAVVIDWSDPAELAMRAEEDDDEEETLDLAGIREIPRDALKTLLNYLIPTAKNRRFKVASYRLVLLAHACGVEGVSEHSFATLAKELKCTRALLSHYAIRMADDLKESAPRGGKRRESRESYRQAALNYHRRAGHKMSAESTP